MTFVILQYAPKNNNDPTEDSEHILQSNNTESVRIILTRGLKIVHGMGISMEITVLMVYHFELLRNSMACRAFSFRCTFLVNGYLLGYHSIIHENNTHKKLRNVSYIFAHLVRNSEIDEGRFVNSTDFKDIIAPECIGEFVLPFSKIRKIAIS